MIYHQLFQALGSQRAVEAAVIGAGEFATAVVTRSTSISRLNIPVIADTNLEAARRAYLGAGFPEADITACWDAPAAARALERGKRLIVEDPMLVMDLPVDVVVESTGMYDAAARHALAAIDHGKHVVMVSKEADCTVGPILKRKADQAGVVYSTGDGDQPGLLIGLVGWALELGLEIVSCGKSRDMEFVFSEQGNVIEYTLTDRTLSLDQQERQAFAPIPPGRAREISAQRRAIAGGLGQIAGFDIAELILVANSFDWLVPECETMVCPIVRVSEIAQVLCPQSEGGILRGSGTIDAVTCLRRPDEAGLGGGVFIVVKPKDEYSRRDMAGGMIQNDAHSSFLMVRPFHLCGVETPMSILCAGLLRAPTGAVDYRQRYDLVACARTPLAAGYTITHRVDDHEGNFDFRIRPAAPLDARNPIPFYLAQGRNLTRNMAAGEILTPDCIAAPADSTIWDLRREQDSYTFADRGLGGRER